MPIASISVCRYWPCATVKKTLATRSEPPALNDSRAWPSRCPRVKNSSGTGHADVGECDSS